MPTILTYLNFDRPYIAFGQNALDTTQERVAINYITGTYQLFYRQYVLLFDGLRATALYDLDRDRMMTNNLKDTLPEITRLLEMKGKAFVQQYNNRMIDNCLTSNEGLPLRASGGAQSRKSP
jgi:hypothetical protein